MANPNLATLRERASRLPLAPGVYLMKDKDGNVIYVGKSRKLKNRVSSYFLNPNQTRKTARLVAHIFDFDYILCDGEMEALTLENTLIKKHSPRYNVRLKDAKSYPYIKVTKGLYPKICVTRERASDGSRYFGPYASSAAAHEVVDTVTRIFALPTCRRRFPEEIGKERPCLYFQMGRCVAPCRGDVSPEEYATRIHAAEGVLGGNIRATEASLTASMLAAAEQEQFELAAGYRDAISALQKLYDKQKVVADADENHDVLALYTDDLCGVLSVLSVRDGKLQNKHEYLFSAASLTEAEDASQVVLAYYEEACQIPREIHLAFALEEEEYTLIGAYLGNLAGHKVTVKTPQRGEKRGLAEMAYTNAKERAARYAEEHLREESTTALLAQLLGLPRPPRRIESYDISEIGKEHITAAMVVTDGIKLRPAGYRTFKMRTISAPDDYAAMREVISRRVAHIGDGSPSLGEKPDLILLDGGVGQVSVVKETLAALGVEIPVFGMIKDDYHKTRALTDGERELSIAQEQGVYTFVYKLQEEVHRVAVRATMGAKTKSLKRSKLEDIKGIGAAKAKKLLKAMPYRALTAASVEEMLASGISKHDADLVYSHFHPKEDTP